MRKGAVLTLCLAVALAGVSAYLARDWLQRQARPVAIQQQAPARPAVTVVVARKALRFGDQLAPEFVEAVAWPSETIPPGAFRTPAELFTDGKPRMALRAIEAYEPILAGKVTGAGERATLSRLLSETMRAVTIRVNDVVGVAGFVLPGDRVDVLVTRDPKGGEEPITDVVMQNIRVLGIDQEVNEDKTKPTVVKAVTVEVTTEQAQKLALAQKVGQLTLALRNEANVTASKTTTIGVDDLRASGRAEKAKAPVLARGTAAAKAAPAVTVVRGLNASREEVVSEPPALLPRNAAPRPLQSKPDLPAVDVGPVPGAVGGAGEIRSQPAPAGRSALDIRFVPGKTALD